MSEIKKFSGSNSLCQSNIGCDALRRGCRQPLLLTAHQEEQMDEKRMELNVKSQCKDSVHVRVCVGVSMLTYMLPQCSECQP